MTAPLEVVTGSPESTRAVGEALAGILQAGDVVTLTGDLGAGKTTFVQGAVRGLGSTDVVTSPTFVLVRSYRGRLPVYHVDVYRLNRVQEVMDLGLDEHLDRGGVVFIEWGDVVDTLFAGSVLEVEFGSDPVGPIEEGTTAERRVLRFSARGPRWVARWEPLDALLSAWRHGPEAG